MHFAQTKIADYDVICLQEQFSEEDFRIMVDCIPQPLRSELHYQRFPSSFIGSGLAIISRYRVIRAQYVAYPTQSHPEKVYHGDCYARKGVAFVRLEVPIGREATTEVNVYTTHLVAQYEKVSRLGSYEKETYAAYRMSQAMTLASFICSSSSPTDNVILCGDFNASPSSPEMRLIMAMCQCNGGIEFVRTLADDDVTNFTYTFENAFNTDSTGYLKFMDMQEDIPIQLDHVFFSGRLTLLPAQVPDADLSRAFESQNQQAPSGVVVFTNNKEVATGNNAFPACPISDHFGVCARFLVPFDLGDYTTPGAPLNARRMASSSFGSIHPPSLVVDPTAHRKALEYGASFLGRSSFTLRQQATRFYRIAIVLIAVPLLIALLHYIWVSNRSNNDNNGAHTADTMEAMLSFLVSVVSFPLVSFLLGVACTVLVLIAKLQRQDDAVVMGWQADELRNLVTRFDWS